LGVAAAEFAHLRRFTEALLSMRLGRVRGPVDFPGRQEQESSLNLLLGVSRIIDQINDLVGRTVYWLILLAVVISSGNAVIRYSLDRSSNAWLEVQWYLFAAVFLLCAGYTLLRNEHIRIDIIVGRFSRRTQAWIDVIGTVLFLMPMALMILWLSWPMFTMSFVSGEMSNNAGGLIRWPAKALIPAGFFLLCLQGLSELIKRIAYLTGALPDYGPQHSHHAPLADEGGQH
jgi:TRAP-type mannitol/chloroaromatic compound transport system permease small subunit